jgi:hypothetical protein
MNQNQAPKHNNGDDSPDDLAPYFEKLDQLCSSYASRLSNVEARPYLTQEQYSQLCADGTDTNTRLRKVEAGLTALSQNLNALASILRKR